MDNAVKHHQLRDDLHRAIAHCYVWDRYHQDSPADMRFVALDTAARPLQGFQSAFTAEEMALLHPDFPVILQHIFETTGVSPFCHVLKQIVRHCRGETIWVPPEAFTRTIHNSPPKAQLVGNFRSITLTGSPLAHDRPYIDVQYNHLLEMAETPDGLSYPTKVVVKNEQLRTLWLETEFPGWRERWLIGQSLSLSDEDLLSHVFSKISMPHPPAELDGFSPC